MRTYGNQTRNSGQRIEIHDARLITIDSNVGGGYYQEYLVSVLKRRFITATVMNVLVTTFMMGCGLYGLGIAFGSVFFVWSLVSTYKTYTMRTGAYGLMSIVDFLTMPSAWFDFSLVEVEQADVGMPVGAMLTIGDRMRLAREAVRNAVYVSTGKLFEGRSAYF